MVIGPQCNLLLTALPKETFDRIAADLRREELPIGQTVFPPDGTPDRFYFIVDGLVSLLHMSADDQSAEIALLGREGGVGLPLVLGGRPFPAYATVQVPCVAYSLRAELLRREFEVDLALQRNLLMYTQALMTQMAHTAVCNRHHSVEMQLARWLLMSIDRLQTDTIRMTQEIIANMLGVRRAGITESSIRLEKAGLIEHTRGQIRVSDRPGLERRVCACYWTIREAYEALEEDVLGEQPGLYKVAN